MKLYTPNYGCRLGIGSFGKVYQSHENPHEIVVKVIEKKYTDIILDFYDDNFIELTQRHHNLSHLFGIYLDDISNKCFIIMEYMSGKDLIDIINIEGKLSDPIYIKNDIESNNHYLDIFQQGYDYLTGKIKLSNESNKRVKNITKDVLQALEFLHENNIIHRDVKPENIRILDDNSIKLFDYSLSCKIDNNPIRKSGSISYCAPELFTNNSSKIIYDTSVDIWSLGCVMYGMMEGLFLYSEKEVSLFRNNHIKHFSSKITRKLWDDMLLEILSCMLEEDVENRLSATELLTKFFN